MSESGAIIHTDSSSQAFNIATKKAVKYVAALSKQRLLQDAASAQLTDKCFLTLVGRKSLEFSLNIAQCVFVPCYI